MRFLLDKKVDRIFDSEGVQVGLTAEMIFYNDEVDLIETIVRNKSFIDQTEPVEEEEEESTQDAFLE